MTEKKIHDKNLPAEHMQLNESPSMPMEARTNTHIHKGKKLFNLYCNKIIGYSNGEKNIKEIRNNCTIFIYMCVIA